MSISAITIENFKGIREPVRIELKPITLLFGPNSSGKSTIVQALHYAREIFGEETPIRTILSWAETQLTSVVLRAWSINTTRPFL